MAEQGKRAGPPPILRKGQSGETLESPASVAAIGYVADDELEAMARLHLTTDGPGRPVLIKPGLRAMRVLNSRPVNDPDRQKPGGLDLLAPVAQRWRDAATALMSDPEALLPSVED